MVDDLGCAAAAGRIFRLAAAVWALWVAGRWLDLPLSSRRYLPYGGWGASAALPLAGDGVLLGPVSCTVALPGRVVCAVDRCSGERRGEKRMMVSSGMGPALPAEPS